MYHGNHNQSSMNYFKDFFEANQEELFYLIYPLIEDRIEEIIEEKLKEKIIAYINNGINMVDIINALNAR